MTEATGPPPAGFALPGFRDFVEIGRGGSGVVYRATQVDLDRTVALKVVVGALDEPARRRFERERRALGALSGHPNIVTVHGSGFLPDGRPYIVMEHLSGGTLADRLARGPLGWPEALRIGIKLAEALEAAHSAGVLHRDVKPDNVLVSQYGEPKLADFGIARLAGGPTVTASGTFVATVAHGAPEVLEGHHATRSSDVYSLGSTVYTLVAGSPAFLREGDETFLPVYARVLADPVPDLRPRRVPDAVCAVLERAMAKEPTQRTPTAAELGRQLAGAVAPGPGHGDTVRVGPPPPPGTVAPPARVSSRRSARALRLLIAGAFVLAVTAGIVLVTTRDANRNDANADRRPGATTAAPTDDPAVAAMIEVGEFPTAVAVEPGAVWVTNFEDDTVSRIDPATDVVITTIDVGRSPEDVAVGAGAVWVTNFDDGTVSRIDPAAGAINETIDAGPFPDGIAVGEGAVWVTNFEDGTVSRLDPATSTITATVGVGTFPEDLAVGEGAVWVANLEGGTVSRIDPTTNTVTVTIAVGSSPEDLAVGEGAVWVANLEGGTVSRIDPTTNTVAATIDVGMSPEGVAVGEGAVWVIGSGDDTASRIDPATNLVTATVRVGRSPEGVAVGAGAVWVTNAGDDTVARVTP